MHRRFTTLLAALPLAMAAIAAESRAQSSSGNGYLLGAPGGSFTVRLGYAQPRAGSDLFSTTTSLLSLSKRDFAGFEVGADIGVVQGDRWEWLVSADLSTRSADSDYRDYIGSDGKPINQSTTFVRVPVLVGGRFWLRRPGTRVGSLAWVPTSWSPFVQLQGGAMWYEFHQTGEFVNFSAGNSVFQGVLTSSGWAATAAVAAGVSINLSPSFALLTQARYVSANKALGDAFAGFQPIDLSGLSVTAGFTFRIH